MKKTSELRRWSNIEVADLRNQKYSEDEKAHNLSKIQSSEEVDDDEHLRECKDYDSLRINNLSQVPVGIDPSMIAVWSQLADFEADLPENISTYSCLSNTRKNTHGPAKFNDSSIMSQINKQGNQHGIYSKQDLSSTQLSNINYPSLDATLCRNGSEDTNQFNATQLSRMESCCVDGTSTQLLVESYCNKVPSNREIDSRGYKKEGFLAASFSVNNSSRSATLLSIPPVTSKNGSNGENLIDNEQQNPNKVTEDEFLLCPKKTNNNGENNCNNASDLNDSER